MNNKVFMNNRLNKSWFLFLAIVFIVLLWNSNMGTVSNESDAKLLILFGISFLFILIESLKRILLLPKCKVFEIRDNSMIIYKYNPTKRIEKINKIINFEEIDQIYVTNTGFKSINLKLMIMYNKKRIYLQGYGQLIAPKNSIIFPVKSICRELKKEELLKEKVHKRR